MFVRYWIFVACVFIPAVAQADITPHALISEGMVLQQQRNVNLSGTADPNEKVVVQFRDQEVSTVAGADGRWRASVASKNAGGPFTLTLRGNNTVTIPNVLVGEVWVASGQSNMWWPVASRPGATELAGTENRRIRLFNVAHRSSDEPQADLAEGKWAECGPASLVGFSAVAYYFGRQIEATQHVPVGLIHASVGGSGVAAWTSARTLAADPGLEPIRQRQAGAAVRAAESRARLEPEIRRYEAALAEAKRNGTPLPTPPRGMNAGKPGTSRLYNGMIAPLEGFPIRGVIWYQGEADVNQAADYQASFSALIRGWRHEWNEGDFPFLFVQIAPYGKIVEQPQESAWARLREAQLRTSRTVPNTAMAVITDWGHETDIHVKQKRPPGERLALLARSLVYGEPILVSGPQFEGLSIEGNRAVVRFTNVGDGLVAKAMVLEDVIEDRRTGETGAALHVAKAGAGATLSLQGFTIAGADQKFYNAEARIVGSTVVVSSPEVKLPVAVRFGWADYPTGNLFNSAGLPASPFRTDEFPPSPPTQSSR